MHKNLKSSGERGSTAQNRVVATIQLPCTKNVNENIKSTIQQIKAAASRGAQLICLQELFSSLYFCQSEDHEQFKLAESIPGPTTDRMCELAKELSVVIVVGIFERRAPGVFHNSAVVIEADGSILGTYRKMHIPDDPYFYEKFYFTPGDLGFQSFQTSVGAVGVCICWDQWFPESARLTAMKGAEILVFPTAIGWQATEKEQFGESQKDAWQTMMRSHAIANGVFVVAPNRVGVEGHIEFWGGSFVVDPYGSVVAQAGQDAETLVVDCDLSLIETARVHWPFFRDRRIDAFDGLTRRWSDEADSAKGSSS
jgi:N-carbamoylputrescine amidase